MLVVVHQAERDEGGKHEDHAKSPEDLGVEGVAEEVGGGGAMVDRCGDEAEEAADEELGAAHPPGVFLTDHAGDGEEVEGEDDGTGEAEHFAGAEGGEAGAEEEVQADTGEGDGEE